MPRFPTDLGLWFLCSGGMFLLTIVGFAADGGGGWPFWVAFAVAGTGCVAVGWVVQDGLVRAGFRLTRPLDQAEDYEDGPRT